MLFKLNYSGIPYNRNMIKQLPNQRSALKISKWKTVVW